MDLLEAYDLIKQIRTNTMAIHLPAMSQEKANRERAKACSKKREALEIALRLIKREIADHLDG